MELSILMNLYVYKNNINKIIMHNIKTYLTLKNILDDIIVDQKPKFIEMFTDLMD